MAEENSALFYARIGARPIGHGTRPRALVLRLLPARCPAELINLCNEREINSIYGVMGQATPWKINGNLITIDGAK